MQHQHIEMRVPVNRELTPYPSQLPARARARTAFFKLYADDFLTGCRRSGMTPEQVGMYIFMLALEWQDKAPLDDDMRVLSVRTGWDVRTVRRIVNSLVQLNKYERHDGLLSNERMEAEIELYVASVKAKEAKIGGQSAVNTPTLTKHRADIKPTLTPDLSEKANKNKATTSEKALYARRALEPEPEPEKFSPTSSTVLNAREVAALPKSEFEKLSERLLTACNGALDNPANCMGLLNLQIPNMWMQRGADLELDVIPTLTAAGKKYHGKRIRDWNYFTGMIFDALKRRLAGLPHIDLSAPKRQRDAEEQAAMRKAENEKLRREYGFDKEVLVHG